ncbi:MAG TPA: MFS transporter [Mycobacteriales bacterium]|nr:MFS transporter [Mycobacteriales bacterium]
MNTDSRRWTALALLCVAAFMVILDASIVTTAVPSIETAVGFTGAGVQWVMTAYIVTFGGLLLFGGRAADLFGRRRIFVAGTALFVLTSLLCGLASSPGALIGFRAGQGIAAAIMTPSAFSIVLTLFPDGPERNQAIGIWGAVSGVGGTAGALIGGPLTDHLGWEWIFFLNVPVGLAVLAVAPLLLPESRPGGRGLDLGGAATVTGALALLIYAVSEGPRAGWSGGRTAVPLAVAVVLLAAFALIESRVADPLLPPRILRSRTLVGGNLIGLVSGMAAFGQGFILTQYGQQVLGWSASRYGVASAVMPVLAVVGSIVGQHLVSRLGFRAVAAGGMVLLAAGCLLWSGISADGGFVADLLPGMLVFGPGLGAGTVAGSIASVAEVRAEDSGLASGINNASFQIGGALGVAILSSVAVSRAGLTHGFAAALGVAVAFGLIGLLVAAVLLRRAVFVPVAPVPVRNRG